jgi:hypothetical protein
MRSPDFTKNGGIDSDNSDSNVERRSNEGRGGLGLPASARMVTTFEATTLIFENASDIAMRCH